MDLPITEEEIKTLAHEGKINENFPYLDNADIMYIAIKEDFKLVKLIEYKTTNRVGLNLALDKTISKELKKEILYHLIDHCDSISDTLGSLIDDEEYYKKLASKSFYAYLNLCKIKHPFKKQEEILFWSLYEDKYTFNHNYIISYAKKSPKVLLNTLKDNKLNIYYISFFDEEAYNDEVVKYIENNIDLDEFNFPAMYRTSKIKMLKLKKDLSFLFLLSENEFVDEIIDYLQNSDFNVRMIDEYIKKSNKTPECLSNSKFILMLLKKDLDNIKYFKGIEVSQELIDYLNQHNYLYREIDNPLLLKDMTIYINFINNGNVSFLLKKEISLNEQQIKLLIEKIIANNIDFSQIENIYLLKSDYFVNKLVDYYKLDNPYNLANKYLISNLGRSLVKLNIVFSNNDIQIIIREIVENNYHLNMLGILDNIDVFRLKNIYDRLYKKVNKFNTNFNFYFFLKVMEYFSNHLSLVKGLSNKEINDETIDNLLLIINNNDTIEYDMLVDYKNIYKKRLSEDKLDIDEKLYKLLVNGDRESVSVFLNDILNIPQLLYLQLEFSRDTLEYQLLESYIDIANLLKSIQSDSIDLSKLYDEIKNKFPNPLFDLSVMKENILRLFARMYHNLGLNRDYLRQKGKCEVINGQEVFDITGEQFVIYLHTEDFNNQYDFTDSDIKEIGHNCNNYICTSYASELDFNVITRRGMMVYEMKNPSSLIDFGSRDIFIHHTKKPLFNSIPRYVNPCDMAFLSERGYTNTEFDYLRIDNINQPLLPSFLVAKTKEEAIKKTLNGYDVIIFDKEKHKEILRENYLILCENVSELNYKDLYRLISLSKRFELHETIVDKIVGRIKELPSKEQIILYDALKKYQVDVKLERKVK